jgi:CheY-like chemotaxis protein
MDTSTPIRVLILEDDPGDAELMVRELRQSGIAAQVERVENETDFVARLTPEPDLILSDFKLPQFGGLEALRLVRSRGLDVPFIIVSGSIGENVAVEAMREGADDYLLKDRTTRLGPAALQALEKKRLRVEMQRAEAALRDSDVKFRQIAENLRDLL